MSVLGTVYTEVTGTICYLDGQMGTVRGVLYSGGIARHPRSAFIQMDAGGMVHAILGHTTGDRNVWSEVLEYRAVTRNEFDRLNGIDSIRYDMGWREIPAPGDDEPEESSEPDPEEHTDRQARHLDEDAEAASINAQIEGLQ